MKPKPPPIKMDPGPEPLTIATMSLRDHFAATAPVSFRDIHQICRNVSGLDENAFNELLFSFWADINYRYADAMLARREGGGKTS